MCFSTEFRIQETIHSTIGLNASFCRKTGNMECDCALTLCPNFQLDINRVDGILPILV